MTDEFDADYYERMYDEYVKKHRPEHPVSECEHEWEPQPLAFSVVEYCRFCDVRRDEV